MLPDFVGRLEPKAITPIRQSLEASCVVASVSMVFTGLGVNISEQELLDSYFPGGKLPATAINAGVTNAATIRGMVQIIEDRGLNDKLALDVFIPGLTRYNRSREDRYLVEATQGSLKGSAKKYPKGSSERDLLETVRELSANNKLTVITANARMLQMPKKPDFSSLPRSAVDGFHRELTDFISKGHIVGPHGGMTMHTRVVDGVSRVQLRADSDEKGFVLIDPRGASYPTSTQSLVWVDSWAIRGDTFDYMFRLSPNEGQGPKPRAISGFRKVLEYLIP